MKKTGQQKQKKLVLSREKVRDITPNVADDKLNNIAGGELPSVSGSISHKW